MGDKKIRNILSIARMMLVEIPEAAAGVIFWAALVRWLYLLVSERSWLLVGVVSLVAAIGGYGAYRLTKRETRRVRTRMARQRLSHPINPTGGASLTEVLLAAVPSTGLLHSSIAAVQDVAADFASDGFVRYYNLYVEAGAGTASVSIQASIASLVRQQAAVYYFPGDFWGDSESYVLPAGLAPFRERYVHRVRGWREAMLLATENAATELAKATGAKWQVYSDGGDALRMTLYLRAKKHTWTMLYELADGALQRDGCEIGIVASSARRQDGASRTSAST